MAVVGLVAAFGGVPALVTSSTSASNAAGTEIASPAPATTDASAATTAAPTTLAKAAAAAKPAPKAPTVKATIRPGPDILYAGPAKAPQLENTGIWQAPPILVSGASAYRNHEFVYQDFLYDDLGADGTYTYPTDIARYANNAADLVEVRVKSVPGATAFRLTYNTMIDPETMASTLALGGVGGIRRDLGRGSNGGAAAETVVTVHGAKAEARRPPSTEQVGGLPVTVDKARRQVTVLVPTSVFDPRRSLRLTVAAGLWDPARDEYLAPQRVATSTNPGAVSDCAFTNVAFRFNERGPWSADDQGDALRSCEIGRFHIDIDLEKLAGPDDDMGNRPHGVPTSGQMTRIYASQFDSGQGRPGILGGRCDKPCATPPYLAGQLQPYSVFIPNRRPPAGGFGVTLNLHSCHGTLNTSAPIALDLANRGEGAIVLTPEGRGPCSWYWSDSAADVFEAWADVMRRHPVDLTKSVVTGLSMGGYGSYKLAAQFPDLFAASLPDIACASADISWPGAPTVAYGGEPSAIKHVVDSFRHVPILSANASRDNLCLPSANREIRDAIDARGYRYDWRVYDGDHAPYFLSGAEAAAFFLGNGRVNPNPAHVSFAYNEAMDERRWGINSDHAYWLSSVRLRNHKVAHRTGVVDVRSHGLGVGDPAVSRLMSDTGSSNGVGFQRQGRTWGSLPSMARADVIDITATNISDVTIDATRAGVTCDAKVNLTSDGPTQVHWVNCP